jgi:adenosylcobinamide-GDP ribazoletransferase
LHLIKKIFSSFIIAFSFLTCIPVPYINKINFEEENIRFSLIFYPLIGLFFGLLVFFSIQLLLYFKINLSIISVAVISIPYLINKFLHFDGLCDTIDAFLPDKSSEERLKILKDTNIGSYAIGVMILFILLKFELIIIILKNNLIPLLIIIPVLSRYSLVFLMFISKYPRKQGTAFSMVGKISLSIFLISTLFFIIINSACIYIFFNFKYLIITVILIFFIYIFSFLFKLYSDYKINGVTGDILGAQNEIIELLSIIIIIITSTFI